MVLKSTIDKIKPVNKELEAELRAHLDNLTKPRGSLGYLEDLAVRYCLAQNTTKPVLGKKVNYIFAGDHGVTLEGVSAYPSAVTEQMIYNFLSGGAAANVLCRHSGVDVKVVDVGVENHMENAKGLIQRKVRKGTCNLARLCAMDMEEAVEAMEVGIEMANTAIDEGATILSTGEMGIGNTTPSAAIFAALLPCQVEEVTGRGTGIDDDKLKRKIKVVKQALELHSASLKDPFETLAAVGGLEIAGITGLILAAAARRTPVVVDGFISTAAALVAFRKVPAVTDYLFFSHKSAEAGHSIFFQKETGIRPILDLGMRLGEGTGAALAIHVIEGAVKVFNEMATFESAGVSQEE